MRAYIRAAALIVGYALSLGVAVAQDGGAAQPSETTETFGSWVVRCQKPAGDAPRACEVIHSVNSQNGVITQIAIGTPPGATAPLIVVQTPLGVLVSQAVTFGDAAAAGSTAPLALPFVTCLQIGCIAQLQTTDESLDALAAAPSARIGFAERTGRAIDIAVPLNGMKDALARLRAG